jgi:adenosylcobinamide kinase/adenosylcobinamide-phosphate guanylyltransferase
MVVDCLTLWLSNLMHAGRDPSAEARGLVDALDRSTTGHEHFDYFVQQDGAGTEARIILVSNEVGLSIAPENALARRFRDEQGRLNQRIAAVADHVELVVAGLPLVLKGTP